MASALASAGSLIICFFFTDTATTEIYTLSLHDALPIFRGFQILSLGDRLCLDDLPVRIVDDHLEELARPGGRSEEHTSELQSPVHLVCRLLLEKKNIGSTLIWWTIDGTNYYGASATLGS